MKQTRSEYKRIHSHEEKPILEQWIVSYLEKKNKNFQIWSSLLSESRWMEIRLKTR